MTSHISKFSEMKQIVITFVFASLCSIVIKGAPITTTPKEEGNNEYLYVMVNASPIREILVKYFAALNNTDLLSACKSCESFNEVASEVLKKRIKPLIIRNGEISDTSDQQIFPTYETTDDIYKDFLALDEWQSYFFLDECNNSRSAEHELTSSVYLHMSLCIPVPEIICSAFNKSDSNFSRDAILIPKVYIPGVSDFQGAAFPSGHFILDESEWNTAIREAKLIFVFSDNLWRSIGSQMNSDILSIRKNRPVSICYVIRNHPIYYPWIDFKFSFLIFHGNNVEASTFLIGTNDAGELREKLLEWKHGLAFLESHHIISFYLRKEWIWLTNSEKIFREVFGIEPFSIQLPAHWFVEAGSVHLNSTTNFVNYGPVFVIVGFKKF